MIGTNTHAVLDYVAGALLITAPWLLNFSDNSAATTVPVVLGSATILYSLLTDYKFSLVSIIPYSLHLVLDVIAALLLIASPWIFSFEERIYWPHLTVGLLEIVVVLISTKTKKKYIRTGTNRF